jgi:hypothetical protein
MVTHNHHSSFSFVSIAFKFFPHRENSQTANSNEAREAFVANDDSLLSPAAAMNPSDHMSLNLCVSKSDCTPLFIIVCNKCELI